MVKKSKKCHNKNSQKKAFTGFVAWLIGWEKPDLKDCFCPSKNIW